MDNGTKKQQYIRIEKRSDAYNLSDSRYLKIKKLLDKITPLGYMAFIAIAVSIAIIEFILKFAFNMTIGKNLAIFFSLLTLFAGIGLLVCSSLVIVKAILAFKHSGHELKDGTESKKYLSTVFHNESLAQVQHKSLKRKRIIKLLSIVFVALLESLAGLLALIAGFIKLTFTVTHYSMQNIVFGGLSIPLALIFSFTASIISQIYKTCSTFLKFDLSSISDIKTPKIVTKINLGLTTIGLANALLGFTFSSLQLFIVLYNVDIGRNMALFLKLASIITSIIVLLTILIPYLIESLGLFRVKGREALDNIFDALKYLDHGSLLLSKQYLNDIKVEDANVMCVRLGLHNHCHGAQNNTHTCDFALQNSVSSSMDDNVQKDKETLDKKVLDRKTYIHKDFGHEVTETTYLHPTKLTLQKGSKESTAYLDHNDKSLALKDSDGKFIPDDKFFPEDLKSLEAPEGKFTESKSDELESQDKESKGIILRLVEKFVG